MSGGDRVYRLRRPILGFEHCDPETGFCYGPHREVPTGTEVRVLKVGESDLDRALVRVVRTPETPVELRQTYLWVWVPSDVRVS